VRRVYANYDATQVHIRKAWLEEQGIPCAVRGETLVGFLAPATMLVVELWVPDDRAEEAVRLLREQEEPGAGSD